jgi:hypothetical protein
VDASEDKYKTGRKRGEFRAILCFVPVPLAAAVGEKPKPNIVAGWPMQ